MKFRYFTDAHLEHERIDSRPFRYSEQSKDLIEQCVETSPDNLDYLIFGGDAMQMNRNKSREHHESLIAEFVAAVSKTKAEFRMVVGNHDYDYFRNLDDLSNMFGVELKNNYIDTNDGHRLIFINDPKPFHERGMGHIMPYSQETIDFVNMAVNSAPTKSVTVFTHTPIDHDDWYETKMLLHDGDPEYSFRPNSDEIRQILEESGKNCLVVAGHTHYETVNKENNVVYMTVQSLVEGVRTNPDEIYARWADFEREGEDIIRVKTHGYKAQEFAWYFDDEAALEHAPLLAAE